MSQRAQQVGQQADHGEPQQHERDRQLLSGRAGAARGGEHRRSDHAQDDRDHRHVLVAPGVLAEHPLAEEQQHQQADRERGLHDDERREQQRHHLQRPAEHRQSRPEQPAHTAHQAHHQRHPQVLVVGSLPGVHRLQGDP
jgi:hypothetical protein